MTPIEIKDIHYAESESHIEIQVRLNDHQLKYRIDSDYAYELQPVHPEFVIMACIHKAMLDGRDIYLPFPVDPVFLSNVQQYQKRMIALPEESADQWLGRLENNIYPHGYDAFARLYKGRMHEVQIHAPIGRLIGANDKYRVGTLASGGVDSVYTMLGVQELTDIIHIDNMNWPNSEAALRIIKLLRPDCRIHQVHSAEFHHARDSEFWIFFAHGTYLAAAALLFTGYLTSMVTAGTDRAPGIEMGSGHDIDYLWSSSLMRFYSYGNVPRYKKIEFIGKHFQGDIILSNLQTCSDAPKRGDRLNCSRCWKCVYTMTLIDACGLRDRATAFDWSHFVEDFQNYPMPNDYSMLLNMPMILDGYKKTGNNTMLQLCEDYVRHSSCNLSRLYKYSWSPKETADRPATVGQARTRTHWIMEQVNSAQSILDIGCFDAPFTRKHPNCTWLDVLSYEQITELSGKEPPFPRARFIQRDANRLPFANKSFDLALISDVLEHVALPPVVLREAARVAARVAVVVPNEYDWDAKYSPFSNPGNARNYNEQLLRQHLDKAGIKDYQLDRLDYAGWSFFAVLAKSGTAGE